jgi:hypothetical protein
LFAKIYYRAKSCWIIGDIDNSNFDKYLLEIKESKYSVPCKKCNNFFKTPKVATGRWQLSRCSQQFPR